MLIWQNVSLSVNDLLSCCGFLCGAGCDGGDPLSAWQYLVRQGVVTEEVASFHLLRKNNKEINLNPIIVIIAKLFNSLVNLS